MAIIRVVQGAVLAIGLSAIVAMSDPLAQMTPELLARHRPDAVLCPLTAPNFDAVDIAAHLMACGFSGPLRALCPPLPNPLVVVQEMRRLCPGINFDLVEVDPATMTPEGPPRGRLS